MTTPYAPLVASLSLLMAIGLGACLPLDPAVGSGTAPPEAPPGAPPGTCWHRNTSPAVIQTVTDQVLVTPAVVDATGQITQPAVFRTVTRQDIVQPRRDTWLETPCPEQLTPEFTASLQRALAVRGYYRGTTTGQMDRATRIAIRRYQKETGLDSSTLSLDTARQLGLIAIAQ
ncbi:peptidoglycan-binding domain-containing protein [Pseudophaeobacter arcticus]|uniref:peptidoglycan-binding domain-containing protein n=1 Tax=Pseudophaeobacter arcticus TaxID=385492 RepID=UPI003A980192